MTREWFVGFFDELYYETYKAFLSEERSEREARFIVEALGVSPGSRVLGLACGYARHASYLARWGYHVTCYDLSLFLPGKGCERLVGFGIDCCVELVNGDMRFVGLRDGAFDAVVSFFTSFGYFGDRGDLETLAEVSRVLRRGGRFSSRCQQSYTLYLRLCIGRRLEEDMVCCGRLCCPGGVCL